MNGIINVYKEKGFTSHDVVAVVRKTLNIKKVGHTGTLDPDAEGVLPICVGRGTKIADYIMSAGKQYLAEVTFGITTTTEDSSGEVIEEKNFVFNEDKIREAVLKYVGEIHQIPPMYSAIKINGKKLYELAREGKEVERKSRQVNISKIEILKFLPPNKVQLLVDCSKGTYIRTLCKDIGEDLGWGAHMSSLVRTQSGTFALENAIKLGELKTLVEQDRLHEALLPLEEALNEFNKIVVAEEAEKMLLNGCKIDEEYFKEVHREYKLDDTVVAYNSKGGLVGIYKITQNPESRKKCIKPIKILFN